ncbi:hypothetical protein ABZ804_21965 [Streptomyces sp. NPDC047726]|uniref:hypothetical protein n=1 Tax=Streptomyces sp. NPDC047726 TaxID=3156651 RepID=UPI0033D0F148
MTTNPYYWRIVSERAADYTAALLARGANVTSGLPVLQVHAAEYGLARTVHVAQMCLLVVVAPDARPGMRTAKGTVDLDKLVPPTADALTALDDAAYLSRAFRLTSCAALTGVEDQIAATARARHAVQAVLDAAPRGLPGRQTALDALWELRDDPRALCAVLALTATALREVLPVPA